MTCPFISAELLIHAIGPRAAQGRTTITVQGARTRYRAQLDVAPFAGHSTISPVVEVFAVDGLNTMPVIDQLRKTLQKVPGSPKLSVLRVNSGDPLDVWMQDTVELGWFYGTKVKAALRGLRAGHFTGPGTVNGGPLDEHAAARLLGPDSAVLKTGDSLPGRKWIDWYGNLEFTPPHQSRSGKMYPLGRVLTGRQGRLGMHRDLLRFLENQAVQWPPIVLDTSFLLIGHVDELVTFVPKPGGFRMVVASPRLAETVLADLASQGLGHLKLLEGRQTHEGQTAEISVHEILSNKKLLAANRRAAQSMDRNVDLLIKELGLPRTDLLEIPIMFNETGGAVWPNVVNGLVIRNHLISPKPLGPRLRGQDVIEEFCHRAFAEAGIIVHFVDAFDGYSRMAGEIHCGTNAVRTEDSADVNRDR